MEEKIIETDVEVEPKETIKQKLMRKKAEAGAWIKDHKKEILVWGPLVVTSSLEIVKILAKKGNIQAEKDLKDLYIYDSKFRHYNQLIRKPTASELRQIDNRMNDGEIMSDILADMGLTED